MLLSDFFLQIIITPVNLKVYNVTDKKDKECKPWIVFQGSKYILSTHISWPTETPEP